MTIRNTSSYINILIMLSIYVLFAVSPAAADEHVKNRHGYQHDSGIFSDHKKADKGNEFTGESAAWVFVIANITVVLSLLSKMLIKFIPPGIALKEKIRAWNNFQKKYLMFFHYVLNPISLIIAFVHFNLSQCRTSSLPESGLALMTILAIIGISVKFGISPKSIRRTVCQFHTNPLPIIFVLIILFAGHSLVD